MEIQEITEKIEMILVEEFEIDAEKLQPTALLKQDVGIDSLDFVDIVVHIFDKESRNFYDLERIWKDGKLIEL